MTITVTDLFAGAGGSSTGMTAAGLRVVTAVNHWPVAVATHQANHPDTAHDCADISQVDPRRYGRTDVLWASPSCTHHSRAQGKRRDAGLGLFDKTPTTVAELIDLEPDRSRATMHDVIRFTEHHRYQAVIVENVREVLDWRLFPHWLAMMTDGLGYHYRLCLLDAADANLHGPAVAQTRLRAYMLFTLGKAVTLPRFGDARRLAAADFLDANPGPEWESKPRAASTRQRVDATLQRHPDATRWILSYYGASKVGKPATEPVGTLTTRDRHAVLTRVGDTLHYRMLNTAEQARLMGFPDAYRWQGTSTEVTKQIGNAVVPAAARDVSSIVAQTLEAA